MAKSKDDLGTLLDKLSNLLQNQWVKSVIPPYTIPIVAGVRAGIDALMKKGFLTPDPSAGPAGNVQKVIDAVKAFEASIGLGAGNVSGILDAITLTKLLGVDNRGCPDCTDAGVPPKDTSDVFRSIMVLRIEKSVLQTNPRAEDCISRAIQSWILQTGKFRCLMEGQVAQPFNVRITMAPLDATGGVLGDAPVAGAGRFQNLTVRLNSDIHDWTDDLMEAAVCHEIGHILGLDHTSAPNSLMNPVIPNGVRTPQSNDITRIQALPWGPPP